MDTVIEHVPRESTELVPIAPAISPATLFGTDSPDGVIAAASLAARSLAKVVKGQNLTSKIQGKDYVRVEGWTLLGSMLGVFPVVTEMHKLTTDGGGWEAFVEARTRDGSVVGGAWAQCTRSEKSWASRDDYALRSMAQTRATSKALRMPLGFVMSLAGFEATPAEEIPADSGQFSPPVGAAKATKKQVTDLTAELDRLATGDVDRDALEARLYERYGTVDLNELSKAQADELLERLKGAS